MVLMLFPDIQGYRREKEEWKNAGKPMRSDERVAEIFDNHCKPCENYIPIPLLEDRGQCGVCTCLLSKDDDNMNKIRWATTRCPLAEPKWTEDVDKKEALKVEPQGRRKPPVQDCGCG
jgi:hypothetical protein